MEGNWEIVWHFQTQDFFQGLLLAREKSKRNLASGSRCEHLHLSSSVQNLEELYELKIMEK